MTANPTLEITVDVPVRTRLASYVALTKPRIIELLLITTVPAMVLAAGGWPNTWLVVATLVGGTLSAAGANTLNCVYDADIDALMKRTRAALSPGTRCHRRMPSFSGLCSDLPASSCSG